MLEVCDEALLEVLLEALLEESPEAALLGVLIEQLAKITLTTAKTKNFLTIFYYYMISYFDNYKYPNVG